MYKLEQVVRRDNGSIVGYSVKEIKSGVIKPLVRDQILILLKTSKIQGLKLSSDNKIIVDKDAEASQQLVGIKVITGQRNLNMFIQGSRKYVHRDNVDMILEAIESTLGLRVVTLMGIRRTGKTTAIQHTIDKLIQNGVNPSSIVYITISNENVDVGSLINTVEKLSNKIIFIDEITKVNGFLSNAAYFSDVLAAFNIKVILSGTDSYAFTNAMRDSLYGRCININFTQLKYTEYIKLFKISLESLSSLDKVDRFIAQGGVLSKEEYSLPVQTYSSIQNSIVQNIINTAHKNSTYRATPEYIKYFAEQDIEKLVYTVVRLVLNVCNINRTVSSGVLKNIEFNQQAYKFIASIAEETRASIGNIAEVTVNDTKYNNINAKMVNSVNSVLSELQVMNIVSNVFNEDTEFLNANKFGYEHVCLMPGLLFSILKETVRGLAKSDLYETEILKDILKGTVTENLVLSQCILHGYDVNFLRYELTKEGLSKFGEVNSIPEIDCIITHYTNLFEDEDTTKPFRVLIEVKHSSIPKTEHAKNLRLKSVDKITGKNTKKIVVYRGETTVVQGIAYVNIHDFLTDMKHWVEEW